MVTCDERNRAAALHGTGAAASGRRLISGAPGWRAARRTPKTSCKTLACPRWKRSTVRPEHPRACSRSSATPLKRGSPKIVQAQSSWSIGAPNAAMQASQETVCRSLETTSTGCESRADWQASDRSGFAVRSQPVSNEAVVEPEGNPPGGLA